MKILFLALVSPLAIFATPEWSAFSHHAEITFPGYAGTTTLTNFPALIRLADGVGGFSYASCCGEKGGDVRFASVGGEELPSSVMSWDVNGTSEFYVKIPELVAGTKILVFWGNASAPAREALATPFDPDTYTLSWSFEEEGGVVAIDGTRQSRYGAGEGATCAGIVGSAIGFDASSSQWVRAPLSVSQELKTVTNFTFEGWAKWDAAPSTVALIFGNTSANWNRGTGFGLMTTGKLGVRDGDGSSFLSAEPTTPAIGTWHHLMIARDPLTKICTAFVDGVQVWEITNKSAAWKQSDDYYFSVAHGVISGWTGYFTGSVDEVRAQSVCRNGDYAAAVYANVVEYSDFIAIANADGEAAPVASSTVRQFPVTISAGANGSVSLPLADALYDEGTVVEVTATPASDDYAFYAWEGNCPTLQVFSVSLKLPVDCARSVTAIFAPACHVSAADGNDATADGSSALPYASIEAAVNAVNATGSFPAVVLVGDGEYTLSYSSPTAKPSGCDGSITGFAVALANRIALRSVNGAASTGINCARNSTYGAILLTDPGAIVDGFAITNAALTGNNWNIRGGWFYSAGGHVQNCFLGNSTFKDNCSCGALLAKGWMQRCTIANVALSSGSSNYGGPLRSTGGLIDSCVFSNNTHRAGIRLGAAFVRNCLFAGNSNPDANSGRSGGAVYCEGQTVFENCTFMNNTAAGYGGAIYGDSVVVNCAFGGNSTAQAANGMDFYNKVRLAYSLSAYTTTVDGNVVGTPTVADAAAGDYASTGVSATRNVGLATSWLYEPGRTDIAGNGRVNESLPDIGAFEYVSNGQEELAVMVSASAYTGTDTLAVNFSATVVGAGAGGVTYAWDFGDGTTSTAATPSHTYDAAGYYTVSLTVTDVDDNTRTASFDDGANLIKVMPSTCYVRAVGESTPVEPYATPGTAANDVYSAFLLSPTKIDIGEGDIPIGESFSVETALEIRGKGPDATRVNMSNKTITLSAVGATVADLTLRNSYRNNEWNVGMVNLCAAGTILTNCVVRDGRNPNAGLVRLTSSGKVVDCTITGGSAHCAGAGGILIEQDCGASVERCLVTNNVSSVNVGANNLEIRGAGIWVRHTGGGSGDVPVVRNCLVARNCGVSTAVSYRGHYGAGICAEAAIIIENCTIVSNVIDRSDYATGLYVSTSSAFVTNTVFWGNFAGDAEGALRESDVGGVAGATFSHSLAPEFATAAASDWTLDACASGDPLFKDFDGGDYTFRGSSPLANAGARLGWMEDATDLAGNIRLLGKPDIGCYECVAAGLSILVR